MSKKLLLEKISKEELRQHLKELYKFLRSELPNIDKSPKVYFNEDQINADDFLGKTGYYDPEKMEIHLFVTDRHAKDILRSFAHELIHHEQNCSGMTAKLDMSKTQEPDYAEKDEGLYEAERDAFERGNMLFRKWTDRLKAKRQKGKRIMNESKLRKVISTLVKEMLLETLPKDVLKKGHKIGDAVAKKGGAKNPYAVGMAKAKKDAGIEEAEEEKDPIKAAQAEARNAARKHIKHFMGKDIKEQSEEAQESLEENINTPYPQLFVQKDRVLQDAFQKREQIIFDELVRLATKENKG